MSEQHLNHANIDVLLEQMGGEAVPQGVRRHALGDARQARGGVHGAPKLAGGHRVDRVLAGEEPRLRPRRPPPRAQQFEQLRREHHVPVPLPLALLDPQRHALTVNIGYLQVRDLGHPQACAVGDAERGFVLEARRGFEETRHFLLAQHDRRRFRRPWPQSGEFATSVTVGNAPSRARPVRAGPTFWDWCALTEIGVIAAQGPRHARELATLIEACDETIPFEVCEALVPLVVQLRNLDEAIVRLDRIIAKLAQQDETARRLMSIPGFGPITASAMAATIQDTSGFAGPREFAAFLGLTPKQNSSGGKPKLGRISKMGNRNLRKLLVVGAHAVLFHRKPHTDPLRMWAKKLIEKKPFKLVAVALANKMARIAAASAASFLPRLT